MMQNIMNKFFVTSFSVDNNDTFSFNLIITLEENCNQATQKT